jgi:23S rRNA (cytosine1962-C5)-methyltransferase
VLNCFSYTGGFTVAALQAGASEVISVDISEPAVGQVQENVLLNGLPVERSTVICADAFAYLRLQRDKREKFDLIVLDPPKFAPTIAQVEKASRGYKDINLLALKLLNPGGILFTFSCSGGVDAPLFQKIVADAALDAHAEVSILESLRQDVDHPVLLSFPESSYLKGLVCYKK